MIRAAVFLLALAVGSTAAAQAYQCGWRISGFSSSGCPNGYQDSDSCGCGANVSPRWYGGQLTLKMENQGGNGVTAAQFVQTGVESARQWNNVTCSNFVIDGSQTMPQNSDARWGDHNNSSSEHGIFWVSGENEWYAVTGSGAGGTLGVTVAPYYGSCYSREYVDADILINGFVYGGWSYNSLLSTVMHEIGHTFGLGHPCLLGYYSGMCSNECQSLMGATGGEFVTPQQLDVDGICALYPGQQGGLGSSCTSSSSCSSAPICITYQGFSYCTHTCGSCEDGYECRNVDSQDVCVRKGAPAVGDACTGVCEQGAVCLFTTEGADAGQCYTECTPSNPTTCTSGDECVELNDGSGACWPPGTQLEGQTCGSEGVDDCAPGLLCLNDGTQAAPEYHCYRECDPASATSCGSDWLCVDLGPEDPNNPSSPHVGVCFDAAGPNEDCWDTLGVCVEGYECTPLEGGGAEDYTCHRSCDWNNANSCGDGQVCQTFVDEDNNPVAGACYAAGDAQEGESCMSGFDCATGLMCVGTAGAAGECLLLCNPSASNCPHPGQTCYELEGSSDGVCFPAGGQAGVDGGSTVTDGGGGTDSGGVVNPDGKDYLEPCAADAECKHNHCESVGDRGMLCLVGCDPRLGHYDCPVVDSSGCVPTDVNALNLPGWCQPGVGSGGLAVGDTCSVATGYRDCSSGLCEGGLCLMACANTQCPDTFFCDTSEIAAPGVCRPDPNSGGICGCVSASPDGARGELPLAGVGVLLLGILGLVRRRAS